MISSSSHISCSVQPRPGSMSTVAENCAHPGRSGYTAFLAIATPIAVQSSTIGCFLESSALSKCSLIHGGRRARGGASPIQASLSSRVKRTRARAKHDLTICFNRHSLHYNTRVGPGRFADCIRYRSCDSSWGCGCCDVGSKISCRLYRFKLSYSGPTTLKPHTFCEQDQNEAYSSITRSTNLHDVDQDEEVVILQVDGVSWAYNRGDLLDHCISLQDVVVPDVGAYCKLLGSQPIMLSPASS